MRNPRIRKLIGSLVLLTFVVIYTLLAMWFGATVVNEQNKVVQLLYYVVAGVAWAFPAFQIIRWTARSQT